MGGLGTFLAAIAGPVVRKALISLGIGVVSYAAISTALNSALDSARSAWAGLGGDVLALISMSGMVTFISVVTGALVARVALMQVKKLELLR